MIKRLTQKALIEGMRIAHNNGYWSDETREYLDKFEVHARQKLDSALNSLYNSCQFKSSKYYDVAVSNGLI